MSDNVEDSQHDYELGIRSEEVYDIINSIPSWITRWGITVISVIVLSLVGLSWLLHYPDTIMIPLRLTANNAPKPVNSRTTGRLIKLLVREGEAVTAGQLLAFVESTASHAQVLALDLYLQQLSESLSRDFPSPGGGAHSTLGQLGELQPAYQTLQQNLTQYLNYQQKGYYQARRQMLQAELAELARAYTNLQEQKTLMQKDFAISKQDFAVQQELFTQKVIPATDFRREERKFLSEEITLKQMEARSFENNLAQSAKQKEILELNKVRSEQRSIMIQAVNTP
jgi:multidrug efflux pump subunit AcrA (membrane-fusion protein)